MNLPLAGKRILIAEDEEDLRAPVALNFQYLGAEVFEAPNGKVALEVLQRERIDLVISDIRMPGGDGVELLRHIKQRDHHFPVVMLITGFSDLSREEAYDIGAEAILAKPFDLDEIEGSVLRLFEPKEIRWQKPVDPMGLEQQCEKTFASFAEANAAGKLRLGRGGIFIEGALPSLAVGNSLSFQIRFESGDILALEGQGIIRWVRNCEIDSLPAGCGVEFNCLPAETRQQVLGLIDELNMRPYLPRA